MLHQVVRDHFETFRVEAAAMRGGHGLPPFVEREFRDFLTCGCLAAGFARFRCRAAVMALRARRKEAFQKQHGVGLGVASFFVKAAVAALKGFPQLNAEIQGDEIVLKQYDDIGMAVGAEGGLVVPVIRDADQRSFADIELAIRDVATRAQDGTLTLDDLKGGTFTITNGGVFGSLMSTPILNPPQVGILGLHKIAERAVAENGQVVIRPMMYLALSYDHRIVDGREAVQFLVRIKELIEDPALMVIA